MSENRRIIGRFEVKGAPLGVDASLRRGGVRRAQLYTKLDIRIARSF